MPAKEDLARIMHKEPEILLSAANGQDLLNHLASIDISVPSRIEGRKSVHREMYSICRLLSSLAATEHLIHPLYLQKRERPDFLLNCNSHEIGIEVTEATSQDYSEFLTLAERDDADHLLIEPCHFSYGTTLTLEQKQSLLRQTKLTGDGWAGDGAEREWSFFIQAAIANKCKKSNRPDFQKFEQNWLLVYDNTPTLFLDEDLLFPYLEKLWPTNTPSCFDKIFIEAALTNENSPISETKIVALSYKSVEYFPLKNLWKKIS